MEPINAEPEAQQSDVVPPSASSYLDPNYWDKRFAREDHYEWFKDYSHFRHLILAQIQPCSSVLELGCGNSQMCEELYRDGVSKLTCIDLSPIAVEKMRNRLLSKGFKEIKVLEADMLALPFEDQCFDVVVEKGTMDVLFVDSGDPWNPHPVATERVIKMLKEVHRVLKHNGIFISIAFGQPHFRRRFFNDPQFTWSVEWNTFGETFHYFFYVLKKGNRSLESYEVLERSANPSKSLFQEELDVEDYLFRINIDEI